MNETVLRMVKLILIAFLAFLSFQSFGQYLPVIEQGKTWNYFSNDFHDQMDSCVITSDTIIDGKTYYEIYSFFGWGMGPELIGYVREDTSGGKVYRVSSLTQLDDEILVYDISMDIGDSINITYCDYIVDSVGYVEGRKHAYLSSDFCWYGYPPVTFIEGIGSIANMFGIPNFDYNYTVLLCAHLDSLNIYTRDYMEWFPYLDSNLCWADVTINIEDGVNTNNPITVYPNPFSTTTTIELELYTNSNIQFTVYNSIGEVVYQIEDQYEPGLHKVSWSPPPNLPSGLYYGVLKTDAGMGVVKMVKQ